MSDRITLFSKTITKNVYYRFMMLTSLLPNNWTLLEIFLNFKNYDLFLCPLFCELWLNELLWVFSLSLQNNFPSFSSMFYVMCSNSWVWPNGSNGRTLEDEWSSSHPKRNDRPAESLCQRLKLLSEYSPHMASPSGFQLLHSLLTHRVSPYPQIQAVVRCTGLIPIMLPHLCK